MNLNQKMILLLSIFTILVVAGCEETHNEQTLGSDGDQDSEMTDQPEQTSGFMLGYAEADISPDEGVILGGFGLPGQHRAATGVHDPLLAQAALFTNGAGEAILIISLDSTMYCWEFGEWGPGIRDVKYSIIEKSPGGLITSPDQIVITSSHSHASTDLGGLYQDIGEGVDKELLEFMRVTLTDLAIKAAEELSEVTLFFGETELNGYTGRDENCSPVLDNTLSVAQARSPENEVLLTIINFAKHPTVLPESNTLASADFLWGFRETMKENTAAPAMFLQGFIAAVHGPYTFSPEETMWDDAWLVGSALTDAVLAKTDEFEPSNRFDIRHNSTLYSCEARDSYLVDTYRLLGMPKRTVIEDDDRMIVSEIPISLHRLGDAEFVVFPGEPSPEYSLAARERMSGPFRFTVGLADDSIGYILDPESVEADTSGRLEGYEAKTGLGMSSGPCAWQALESLGWLE